MSEFPTCQEHKVLKPCPHCEPSKYAPAAGTQVVCGDVQSGELLELCTCGKLRAAGKEHGYSTPQYGRRWPF